MGIYHVTYQGTYFQQAMVNTAKYNGNDGVGALDEFVAWLGAEFKARLSPAQHTSVTWNSIHVRRLEGAYPGFDFIPTGWPFTGAKGGAQSPAFVAVGVSLVGQEAKYPHRGAVRLAGVPEEDYTAGNLVAGAITSGWQTAADLWKTVFVGSLGSWQPVLFTDRFAPEYNFVATATVNARITTQNSRKVGRGG